MENQSKSVKKCVFANGPLLIDDAVMLIWRKQCPQINSLRYLFEVQKDDESRISLVFPVYRALQLLFIQPH
jgi:hypothetical protein